ncbi:MAG: hypothetical protein K2I76_00520, partial [Malacoplasma sp.]|nr:hypothetical protein [Malacoplasma sp.]
MSAISSLDKTWNSSVLIFWFISLTWFETSSTFSISFSILISWLSFSWTFFSSVNSFPLVKDSTDSSAISSISLKENRLKVSTSFFVFFCFLLFLFSIGFFFFFCYFQINYIC